MMICLGICSPFLQWRAADYAERKPLDNRHMRTGPHWKPKSENIRHRIEMSFEPRLSSSQRKDYRTMSSLPVWIPLGKSSVNDESTSLRSASQRQFQGSPMETVGTMVSFSAWISPVVCRTVSLPYQILS